jgi:cytochrome c oxidase assembly protein subunit 15
MIVKLCKIALAMALVVVTLGALTRLLDAGLACPDWPGCYGQLIPPTNEQYNGDAVIDEAGAWLEMIHRYLASALGLMIIIIAVKIELDKSLSRQVKWLSRGVLLLVIVQGVFGMMTVVMKLLPQVVTLHLLGGMLILALLLVLLLKLTGLRQRPMAKNSKVLALFVLVLLSGQIALGGWTSSNYAGLACPDFPTCQQQWLPELELSNAFNLTDFGERNYQGALLSAQERVTIVLVHRIVALALLLSIIILAIQLWQSVVMRYQAVLLLLLTVVQLSIGIANAILLLPLPLALAHNTAAALLLLMLVYINYILSTPVNTHHIEDGVYSNKTILNR